MTNHKFVIKPRPEGLSLCVRTGNGWPNGRSLSISLTPSDWEALKRLGDVALIQGIVAQELREILR